MSELSANVAARITYQRVVGFQGFVLNKAYVVSDAVPRGKARAFLALSAFHLATAGRILHFFAIPPEAADSLVNATSDAANSFFLTNLNSPPIREGVLISVGGNSTLPDMQSAGSSSVNGALSNVVLPERWKILCFVDSPEGATNPSADGITLDMAFIDFDYCECLPDGLL